MNERIKYIDIAKCIAMLLVIYNHFELNYNNNTLKIIIASFHMPLFFVLSGLTIRFNQSKMDLMHHLKKRFYNMYLPFILWSLIYIKLDLKNILLILYGSNHSIGVANGAGGSWFIPCFIVADFICCICYRYAKKNSYLLVVYTVSMFSIGRILGFLRPSFGFPFSLDVCFVGAAFMIIGIFLKENKILDNIQKYSILKKMIIFIIFVALNFIIAIVNKSSYNNEYNRAVMALAYYGNYVLFIISSLFGTFSVILFSMLLDKNRCNKLLLDIGKNTFLILLTQQIFVTYVELALYKIEFVKIWYTPFFFGIIILILCHFLTLKIVAIFPNLGGKGIKFRIKIFDYIE